MAYNESILESMKETNLSINNNNNNNTVNKIKIKTPNYKYNHQWRKTEHGGKISPKLECLT